MDHDTEDEVVEDMLDENEVAQSKELVERGLQNLQEEFTWMKEAFIQQKKFEQRG